jgi:hypothetical protein
MRTPPTFKKFLAIAIVVLFSSSMFAAYAQQEQPKPAASSGDYDHREAARESYKLDFTFSELDGNKKVNSRTYTVMCEDLAGRTMGHLRIGSRVPVAIGGTAPGGGPSVATQFQYMDVGMKIDAILTATKDGGLSLATTVDVTSLAEPAGATGGLPPVVRSMQFNSNSGITPGKPVVLSTADDVGSNRRFEVQVVATKLNK